MKLFLITLKGSSRFFLNHTLYIEKDLYILDLDFFLFTQIFEFYEIYFLECFVTHLQCNVLEIQCLFYRTMRKIYQNMTNLSTD